MKGKIKQEIKCNDCCCGCEDDKKSKIIKVSFCPKCKSKDVGYIFTLKNAFGLLPKMKCRKCGFESIGFPILVVDENKLNKMRKKK